MNTTKKVHRYGRRFAIIETDLRFDSDAMARGADFRYFTPTIDGRAFAPACDSKQEAEAHLWVGEPTETGWWWLLHPHNDTPIIVEIVVGDSKALEVRWAGLAASNHPVSSFKYLGFLWKKQQHPLSPTALRAKSLNGK